jgi:hypothetical protein
MTDEQTTKERNNHRPGFGKGKQTSAQPATSGQSLRSLNLPRSIQVEEDQDRPLILLINGFRLPVEAIQERWRIDDEWWRRPISRLYYQVLLAGGDVLTIFKDLETGEWFQQQY